MRRAKQMQLKAFPFDSQEFTLVLESGEKSGKCFSNLSRGMSTGFPPILQLPPPSHPHLDPDVCVLRPNRDAFISWNEGASSDGKANSFEFTTINSNLPSWVLHMPVIEFKDEFQTSKNLIHIKAARKFWCASFHPANPTQSTLGHLLHSAARCSLRSAPPPHTSSGGS